jgi:signal transduction histidine kinase
MDIVGLRNDIDNNGVDNGIDLHNAEIDRLRDQLWVGLMVVTFLVLVITRVVRMRAGETMPPLSWLIQGMLHLMVFANLFLRKTRYASLVRGIFVVCIHLAVPPVLVFYGGTRGFGDIALFSTVLLSLLYGWRRWMVVSFTLMALTLVWVFYLDGIGQPVAPLLDYSARFTSLKFFILMFVMVFLLRYITVFYHSLLDKYRSFADEQVRFTRQLQANSVELAALTRTLQGSRQKIVTAREEERRRMGRDLHDGLGPLLAAQVFRTGVARQMVHKNPQKTESLLVDLESNIEVALADIRRLVYGLRPPLLDQLGLIGAITSHVSQLESQLVIDLQLAPQLPPLSAAAEAALFRMVQTALDNVIRHAQANHCQIRLDVSEGALWLVITDDGIGIAPAVMAGVGLTSMRERMEELGGTFASNTNQPTGTRLSASIPLLSDGQTPPYPSPNREGIVST